MVDESWPWLGMIRDGKTKINSNQKELELFSLQLPPTSPRIQIQMHKRMGLLLLQRELEPEEFFHNLVMGSDGDI
jgi:hypothetical protein